jgi:hypothetical protein
VVRMRRSVLPVVRLGICAGLLALGVAASAAAQTCSVELSGSYRCSDGTVLKPNGQGGFQANNGATLSPDGSGGFRSQGGLSLRPNGYGGLSVESGGATTGGSYGAPLRPAGPQTPDPGSGLRSGAYGGYAFPQSGRDCRADGFGGYRCR